MLCLVFTLQLLRPSKKQLLIKVLFLPLLGLHHDGGNGVGADALTPRNQELNFKRENRLNTQT